MAIEEVTEELIQSKSKEPPPQHLEKPLTPEEIWSRLDEESKAIASIIALHGISISLPFLEKTMIPYIEKYHAVNQGSTKGDLIKKLEMDLVKLIGTGVVEWTTPKIKNQQIYNQGFNQTLKSNTYTEDVKRINYSVAKTRLEKAEAQKGENERYVFINKSFKKLAIANARILKPF